MISRIEAGAVLARLPDALVLDVVLVDAVMARALARAESGWIRLSSTSVTSVLIILSGPETRRSSHL